MKKINLAQLEKQQLENKEMNTVRGGAQCGCGCMGGAESSFNLGYINYQSGKTSGAGPMDYWLPEVILKPTASTP